MGTYANVRRKNIFKLLNWLVKKNNPNIILEQRTNHLYVLKYTYWDRPFPIPFDRRGVNKHIVKDLRDKLVDSKILTEQEFNRLIA